MKNMKLIGLFLVAVVAQACGERGDSEAGTDFRVNLIEAESTDLNTTCNLNGVSVFQKDSASVVFESKATRNSEGSGELVDVILDGYTIEYTALDGGPALSGHSYPFEQTALVPGDGSTTLTVELLPIVTKKQYRNATTGTTSFTKISFYKAHYVFTGETEYHVPVETEADLTFALGNNYIIDCQ